MRCNVEIRGMGSTPTHLSNKTEKKGHNIMMILESAIGTQVA
jgi:hypothetical protein